MIRIFKSCILPGLSLIFQVDGELKKVARGQKRSGAAAELAGGVGGYSGGWGLRKIHKFFLKRFLMQPMLPILHVR